MRSTATSPGTDRLPRAALLLLALAALAPAAAFAPPRSAFPEDTPPVEELEAYALELLNQSRAEENLPPLSPDPKLANAARLHSEEMRDLDYMGHESPTDAVRTMGMRIAAAGVSDSTCGENVGFYANNRQGLSARAFVKELHRGLMNSPRHRANILHPDFTHAGMGLALGEKPAEENPYPLLPAMWITQNFTARPVEVDEPAVTMTADGIAVTLSGRTGEKRLSLSIRDRRNEPLQPVHVEEGRFTHKVVVPFNGGRVRLELCIPEGRNRWSVTNSWEVDPSLRPDRALRAAATDEK